MLLIIAKIALILMSTVSTIYKPCTQKQNDPVEAKAPTKFETILMRVLIVIGVISTINFILWFFGEGHVGYYPLFILLSLSISYKLLKVFFEWYHYWSIKVSSASGLERSWKVDMFTTAVPEEPFEMIKKTLIAMKNVRYPHNTYLCDEGNDESLRRLCRELNVIHITRNDNKNAKAGNINNALRIASGDICVILDPDHEPLPEFLDHVLPYFSNPKVGFVQIVQAYSNIKESFIAKGAAQQTYTFYGPLMMGMNSYGTVQALGANCTFRREALNSIGGHAPGLAEDMHTAMQLHAKGWESVYLPKILAKGLVPSTLPAYYKQQLKWSRGTFELLLTVFPVLFKKFSWRQKIHYFLLPLHFAVGLVVLIDISVPLTSLITGVSPLRIELNEFAQFIIPFAASVFFIRQYAQKWLIERHEIGLHIIGGAVLLGTWWVYLLGFIYTLFRIKVPYIATPKDDRPSNNLLLSLPNIIVCILCLGAVSYSLFYDWNPYNLLMAGFAIVNLCLLSIVVLSGQHELISRVTNKVSSQLQFYQFLKGLHKVKNNLLFNCYTLLRNGATAFVLLIFVFSLPIVKSNIYNGQIQGVDTVQPSNTGGFYMGAYMPAVQDNGSLATFERLQNELDADLQIVSIYQFWGPASIENFPSQLLNKIKEKGGVPMITWEPYVSSFPERPDSPELRYDKKGMAAIAAGKFDDYIKKYASRIQAYGHPVFIRFGHEADNPAYPWSLTGENTPEEYKAAWRQVVSTFAALGVSNVTWVWTPWDYSTFDQYYPGDQFVDWIGVTCLNYGRASHSGQWGTFDEIYNPFRSYLLRTQKPVMLAEFGTTNYGGDATEWFVNSFNKIKSYKEIKSVVFFNSEKDKNWITSWRPSATTKYIDWTLKDPKAIAQQLRVFSNNAPLWTKDNSGQMLGDSEIQESEKKYVSSSIKGQLGSYRFIVNGNPFYIKGVAYNAMHEWRDGHYPLTKRQLEDDFQAIKDMGANTIRRYHPSIYDRNILEVAHEKNLMVIYGFWFDPKTDYYQDTLKVQEYIRLVEQKVLQYKSSRAVLAWSVGNETSGLLKQHYNQPYLYLVRDAYMRMVESISQRIHQLDPERAVISSLEHSWQLPGELYAYNHIVPSVDVIGINSYYDQQISKLKDLTSQFDPTRPYLVSEFGPSGYWNLEYTTYNKNESLIEEKDQEKAALYSKEWNEYILKNKGYNIGGVAFSWRDRYEGTATWFGLVDYKDRKKAAYYALQNAWLNQSNKYPLPKVTIIGPDFKILPKPTYELFHNNSYRFTALYKTNLPVSLEWKLYRDDNWEEVGKIEKTEDPNVVKITLPKDVKNCRLYVYVFDSKGNVTTANKPIAIYKH